MIFILFYSGGPLLQRLVFSLIRSSSLLGIIGWVLGKLTKVSVTVPARLLGSALGIRPCGTEGKEAGLGRGRSWLVVDPVGPRLVHRELQSRNSLQCCPELGSCTSLLLSFLGKHWLLALPAPGRRCGPGQGSVLANPQGGLGAEGLPAAGPAAGASPSFLKRHLVRASQVANGKS